MPNKTRTPHSPSTQATAAIQGEDHRPQKPHWTQYGMFYATVAAFLGVCVYTGFTREQVSQSEAANRIAKQALAEANRPYVLWNGQLTLGFFGEKGDQPTPHVGIQWINYGNTPAYDALTTMCDPVIRTERDEPNFTCVVSEKQMFKTVVGPKQVLNLVGKPLKEEDLLNTRDGSKHIFLLGKIEYRDDVSLDDNDLPKSRITWFCTSVISANIRVVQIPNTQPATPLPQPSVQGAGNIPLEATPMIATPCSGVNCSDQSCTRGRVPPVFP